MRVEYDKETDTLMVSWSDVKVKESNEVAPGVIIDYGVDKSIVGVEILHASRHAKTLPNVPFALELSPAA